ncbi:MAG: hypothetical protein AAF636_09645 [Pseudomonadota bacterium]
MSEAINDEEIATQTRPTPLGIYDRAEPEGLSRFEIAAAALTFMWLIAAGSFFLITTSASASVEESLLGLRITLAFLAIVLPIGLIWVTASSLRGAHDTQRESQRLQAAIDAMRQSYIARTQGGATGDEQASVARKLDEIAAATRKTETVLATFTSRREGARVPQGPAVETPLDDEQPALELGTQAEDTRPPLETDDFLRALNFPETAEDEAGFAALRRAMQYRTAAQLIQAAQDALTLLSQDGIYMDDLVPDRARPEIWRQFGQGARGRNIASLGGIRDRAALALTAGRMKQDPIFRDTAHHFLRRFDQTFAIFEKVATDAEIQMLAETRTARAFMLLGRVAGTFD